MKLASATDFMDLGLSLLSARVNSWWGRSECLRQAVGDLSYLCRPGKRRIACARLSTTLGPTLPLEGAGRIVREAFRMTWVEREIFWLRLLASEPDALSRVRALVTVEGEEYLRDALAAGRGAVLWESPLGNRTLGRLALSAAGFRLTVVHGPNHGGSMTRLGQAIVRRLYRCAEARLPVEVVDIDENSSDYIELLMDRLRQNGVICINGLGSLGRRALLFDFLGRSRRFLTGSVSLAFTAGAALIPAVCYRDATGQRHVALHPPFRFDGGASAKQSQERGLSYCLSALEPSVLRYPGQWVGWEEKQ